MCMSLLRRVRSSLSEAWFLIMMVVFSCGIMPLSMDPTLERLPTDLALRVGMAMANILTSHFQIMTFLERASLGDGWLEKGPRWTADAQWGSYRTCL